MIQTFIDQTRDLPLYERRGGDDFNEEVVVYNKDLEPWLKVLNSLLDPAAKPAGVKPSKEINAITSPFGGIRDDQTLYKKDFPEGSWLAMLWPWQDKQRTTLKLFFIKK